MEDKMRPMLPRIYLRLHSDFSQSPICFIRPRNWDGPGNNEFIKVTAANSTYHSISDQVYIEAMWVPYSQNGNNQSSVRTFRKTYAKHT